MGVFSSGLGFNLTSSDPLKNSPFIENIYGVSNVAPATNFFALLDDGTALILLDDGTDFLLLD